MKKSIIRGLFLFVAGAGCASVVAQMYPPEEISPVAWQERANKALIELATLGVYVNTIDEGRVGIDPIACGPAPIPKQPVNAVDPRLLRRAVNAMYALNEGYWVAEKTPVYAVEKCKGRY